jgi:hypothetical protein
MHELSSTISPETSPGRQAASVQWICPRCDAISARLLKEAASSESPACGECGLQFAGGEPMPAPGRPLESCWVCGNRQFYVQKDFNRELGLAIVIGSFFLVFLVMLLVDHRAGIFCLFGLALIDWLVYRKLRNVTVCYLCQSIYRGLPLNPAHRGFYLGDEERFKGLRPKWLAQVLEGK